MLQKMLSDEYLAFGCQVCRLRRVFISFCRRNSEIYNSQIVQMNRTIESTNKAKTF